MWSAQVPRYKNPQWPQFQHCKTDTVKRTSFIAELRHSEKIKYFTYRHRIYFSIHSGFAWFLGIPHWEQNDVINQRVSRCEPHVRWLSRLQGAVVSYLRRFVSERKPGHKHVRTDIPGKARNTRETVNNRTPEFANSPQIYLQQSLSDQQTWSLAFRFHAGVSHRGSTPCSLAYTHSKTNSPRTPIWILHEIQTHALGS